MSKSEPKNKYHRLSEMLTALMGIDDDLRLVGLSEELLADLEVVIISMSDYIKENNVE